MADEVQAHIPTGNGGALNLRLGSKSIGLTGPVIIPALCLVLLGGFGYFMAHNLTTNQERGFAGLAHILETMGTFQRESMEKANSNQKEMIALLQENRAMTRDKLQNLGELVTTNRTELAGELRAQNQLVFSQTQELRQAVEAQTTELIKRLSILSYNIDRPPGERLPLNVSPEQLPQPERPH
jgi:hypothetical protein